MAYEDDLNWALKRLNEKIAAIESPNFQKYLEEAAEKEGIKLEPDETASMVKALKSARATLEMGPAASELDHERWDRKTKFFEIIVPYMADGLKTYAEILPALTDEEFEEVQGLLAGGTIKELME